MTDFRKLCAAMRLMEGQSGDARICDAEMVVALAHGPMTFEGLATALGLSNSSVGRNAQRLGLINRKGERGYGLITVERDPLEGRRFLAMLSPKGRRLIHQCQH